MMHAQHAFFDDVQRFANLGCRRDAEQVTAAVLNVRGRRLSLGQANHLSAYLPVRAARALTRFTRYDDLRPDVEDLRQEVAALTKAPDPADVEADLGGVVAALEDVLPSRVFATLLEAVPGAAEVIALHHGTRCLLCSPLPWADAAR